MDTTLLQRSSWKNGGQAKQFGTDLWEWEGPVWSFLVRKLKSLGLTVDGISASFCGLGGFAAVCQRPFHRLHKWKRSLRLFLSMVYTTAQRDYAVFWCASNFPKSWLLFYLGFSGLLFRRRRTLTTPYHNPATKQCPVHVCQMYLPLSLSWSIFQWLLSLSWLRWIQPRQRFCPEQSEFTVILGAFYRLQEEMIKHTKVESMLDRSQIFTTAAKSKQQIGIRGIIWKNACRKSKQHFILMACWTIK